MGSGKFRFVFENIVCCKDLCDKDGRRDLGCPGKTRYIQFIASLTEENIFFKNE